MRDYTQTPEALLRALINQQAGLPLPVSDTNLIFGRPSTLLDNDQADSQVNIRGIEDSEYRNRPTQIQYDRLDLATLFQGAYTPEFTALGQSSLHRLLPELNRALGIHLTARDVENIDVSTLGEGEQVFIELRARPGSLAYKGVTQVIFNRRLLYLADVVSVTTLDELHHPDPQFAGYTSAGLLTWGQDFTLIGPQLAVNRGAAQWRGDYRDLSALQATLQENYGIADWPGNDHSQQASGTIRDLDTRQVPEANTEFQRVVVQTQIRQNGYIGTAYFHYNPL